jgi:hypothetical protein
MVIRADARKKLLEQVHAIVGAGDSPSAAENARLLKLSQVLSVSIDTAVVPAVCDPCCEIDKPLIVSRKADELTIGDHCIASTSAGSPLRLPSSCKSKSPKKVQ